jgi:hypothetical protein
MADVIVTSNQRLFNKPVKNVLCFGNLVDDPVILQTFANSFRASYVQHINNFLATEWSLDNLTFSFIDATTVLYSVTYDFDLGVLVGGNTADNIAAQTALLVSTQRQNTKPNRGRVYIAGVTDQHLANGLFVQSVLDAAENLVDQWRTGLDIGGSTSNLRILRRPSASFPNYVSNGVDSVIPRPSPAVQRSRRINA